MTTTTDQAQPPLPTRVDSPVEIDRLPTRPYFQRTSFPQKGLWVHTVWWNERRMRYAAPGRDRATTGTEDRWEAMNDG